VNNELKQQGDGAGEHLKNDKLRVAWHGSGNTRARRTNTAKRAPNMRMHHRHVSVLVCTVFILWNFHTIQYDVQNVFVCQITFATKKSQDSWYFWPSRNEIFSTINCQVTVELHPYK